jgi:hypothetical protein
LCSGGDPKLFVAQTWLQGRGQPTGGAAEWRIDESIGVHLAELNLVSHAMLDYSDVADDLLLQGELFIQAH